MEVFVSTSLTLNRICFPSGENRGLNGRPFTSANFFSAVPFAEVVQISCPFTDTSSSPLGDHAASSADSLPSRADATRLSGIVHSSRFFAPARIGDASRLVWSGDTSKARTSANGVVIVDCSPVPGTILEMT
jgi:hypothetical protein